MACFVSDGFQETLGESMTALKLGGLVLKEEQKAALYVFYRRVLESPLFYLLLYLRIMCILCTPRPIYRSTYRPTYRSSVGRHIDRCSTDMSVDMSTDTRRIYRSRCVGRHINRHINRDIGRYLDRHSTDMSTESCCPTVGRHVDR